MTDKVTLYAHRQADVKKGLITKAELQAANGTKTLPPYGDHFRLFRLHAAGQVDEHGIACDVQMDSPAYIYKAEAQSSSLDLWSNSNLNALPVQHAPGAP